MKSGILRNDRDPVFRAGGVGGFKGEVFFGIDRDKLEIAAALDGVRHVVSRAVVAVRLCNPALTDLRQLFQLARLNGDKFREI